MKDGRRRRGRHARPEGSYTQQYKVSIVYDTNLFPYLESLTHTSSLPRVDPFARTTLSTFNTIPIHAHETQRPGKDISKTRCDDIQTTACSARARDEAKSVCVIAVCKMGIFTVRSARGTQCLLSPGPRRRHRRQQNSPPGPMNENTVQVVSHKPGVMTAAR